jgi:hypothetical protein
MSSTPYSPISPAEYNNQQPVRIDEDNNDGDEPSGGAKDGVSRKIYGW